MRTKILFVSLLGLFLSCNSQKSPVVAETEYHVMHKSSYGGLETEGFEIASSEEKFQNLCTKLQLDQEQINNFEKVDFDKNDVIAVYMGQKFTGGYEIEIEKITVVNDTTTLIKKVTGPKLGEMVTTAITNPYCLVVVSKNKTYVLK